MRWWPWVSRELFEAQHAATVAAWAHYDRVFAELQRATERYDAVVEKMLSMRRDGFYAPDIRTPRPAEDVEKNAVRRAEAAGVRASEADFKANAKRALMAEGLDGVVAEREAERLYRETTDLDPGG